MIWFKFTFKIFRSILLRVLTSLTYYCVASPSTSKVIISGVLLWYSCDLDCSNSSLIFLNFCRNSNYLTVETTFSCFFEIGVWLTMINPLASLNFISLVFLLFTISFLKRISRRAQNTIVLPTIYCFSVFKQASPYFIFSLDWSLKYYKRLQKGQVKCNWY